MRLWGARLPPSQELLASPRSRSDVDTLALPQWLPWMLIPRMAQDL